MRNLVESAQDRDYWRALVNVALNLIVISSSRKHLATFVPLTLREERKLRVFENRILKRMFGPKRDENGEWRRLHNEILHSFTIHLT